MILEPRHGPKPIQKLVKIHDSKKTFIFRYKKLIDSAKSAGAYKTTHIW